MKRVGKAAALLLVLMLSLVSIVGCVGDKDTQGEGPEGNGAEPGVIAKLGLGHITSIENSKDLVADEDGDVTPPSGQVDTVIAVLAFDGDDKIVKAIIDSAQSLVKFDEELQVTSDLAAKGKTKIELGDAYGMKKVSEIDKEWFEQIQELANWMVGKTIDEVQNLQVKEREPGYPAVPDVPELTSLVTITVQDYLAAAQEAFNNAVEIPEGAVAVGLGTEISISGSKGYSVSDDIETLPLAQVDTTMSAAAFDEEGKVVQAVIDVLQTKIAFDAEGQITTDKTAPIKSKKELGDAYGMKKASEIGKEWHEQIVELEKWMVGKTAAEITALSVKERGPGYPAVPDDPELTSLVTVTVQDYLAVIDKAYENSK